MKVLHTISSMDIHSGGPTTCLYNLVKGLNNLNTATSILTYSDNTNDALIGPDDFIKKVSPPRERRYGYSKEFQKRISRYRDYDIFHGNALWQYPTHALANYAQQLNKPYLISTHGMLYPEGLKKSRLVKKIALSLFQRRDLEKATVIHATCEQEMVYIRGLGLKNPIAVIPNAIDITIPPKIKNLNKKKRQVGFLGRFAPIKNLDLLLKAWAATGRKHDEWELVLIGDGDLSYKNELLELAKALDIHNIRFTGFLSGEDKEKALQLLDYLVLPSKSENFGMVVTEALLREIPVIASTGTPWEELNTINAGRWIDIGVPPLVEALWEAILMSAQERRIMGQNGRNLVEEKYSIEAVASDMVRLYQWLLGQQAQPVFVYDKS